MEMLCRQCEQTAGGRGCTVRGVCGKAPGTAMLQDILLEAMKGIAVYADAAAKNGADDPVVDLFVIEGLFSTVTNVNFDDERLLGLIEKSRAMKGKIEKLAPAAAKNSPAADFTPAKDAAGLEKQGAEIIARRKSAQEDIQSLKEMLLYGIKGAAAYADHAWLLGKTDNAVPAFFHRALVAVADENISADELTGMVLECGKINLRCMELLDAANTGAYGSPRPTGVALGVKKGPAIIISGHDLMDLKRLLEQSENSGVNVYTHGEMLPAHGYPELKKHKNLAGHFGSAWQNQQKEFDGVPAAILMTTNCIQKPLDSYSDRIFTTGLVAFPGVAHIGTGAAGRKDFSAVIKKAKELGGFAEDKIEKNITVGFGHDAVLGVAGKIIDAVKTGKIRHFFLIGGCDGAKPGRNYYTEFAAKAPKDTVILTLACGKFRFNRLDFGEIAGLPRLIDIGQCNDAYSAVKIASALAEAFGVGVNELPLSLIISWYEQKAVAVLLTLLALGIKNIRLGPSLPAFVSPGVLKLLVEKFKLTPVTDPERDLKEILGA